MAARALSEVSKDVAVDVDSTDLWFFLTMTQSYARKTVVGAQGLEPRTPSV